MTFEKFMRNYISICTNILVVFFNFNFLPFPFSDISPVIARSCRTGLPIASDRVAVTIAHPALGPSFSTNVFILFQHMINVHLSNIKMQKLVEKMFDLPLVSLLPVHEDEQSCCTRTRCLDQRLFQGTTLKGNFKFYKICE